MLPKVSNSDNNHFLNRAFSIHNTIRYYDWRHSAVRNVPAGKESSHLGYFGIRLRVYGRSKGKELIRKYCTSRGGVGTQRITLYATLMQAGGRISWCSSSRVCRVPDVSKWRALFFKPCLGFR